MTTIRRNKPKALQVVPELVPEWPPPSEHWAPETAEYWEAFGGSQVASLVDQGALRRSVWTGSTCCAGG